MKHLAFGSAAVLLLLASCRPGEPATPTGPPPAALPTPRVSPQYGLDDFERPAVRARSADFAGFARGINLGNGLDAPSIGAWGVVLSETHFDLAAEAGFDHVRLPVRFSAHALATAPYKVEEDFFRHVDWAIREALERNLGVVVDFHHYGELSEHPEQHAERFVGIWEQIAKRYRDRPSSVVFELLNEPCQQLDPGKWNELLARAHAAVRKTNPDRFVLVDSYFWAASDYLRALRLPADPNVVATFHMYQPILFTHQGAEWMDPEYSTVGVVFPGPPARPVVPTPEAEAVGWVREWFEKYNTAPLVSNPGGPATVFAHFRTVENYIEQTGRRVYLGEFAAIDNADPQSRANYIRLVREEAERHNIGWAYWDDGGRNQAMRVGAKSWVPFIREALLPPPAAPD